MHKVLNYIKLKLIKKCDWVLGAQFYGGSLTVLRTVPSNKSKLINHIDWLQEFIHYNWPGYNSSIVHVEKNQYNVVTLSLFGNHRLIDFVNIHNLKVDYSTLNERIEEMTKKRQALIDMRDALSKGK